MKAAAVQLNSTEDRHANREAVARLTRAAAADGADLVVLPEKWTALGTGEDLRAAAEPLDGPTVRWCRELAADLRIDLIAGSISERLEDEARLANTSLHIDPDGQIRAVYRKIHMFDVVVDGQRYEESEHARPGDEIVLTRTVGGVEVGMSVCYDLRFPELYRILTVSGARVLVVPSAFTLATTRDHWEVLLRARAIENQAFVIAPNQFGAHRPDHRSGGRSMIVDPWGLVLAQCPDREGVAIAELDLEHQREIRGSLPSLANRRPQVYRWPAEAPA